MEDRGQVRRGYFVEGLGGAQFALAGAVDRLRTTEPYSGVIAATDPANPYGAGLPWPEGGGRPSRRAGAYVVLHEGVPAVFIEPGGRSLVTFGTAVEEAAAAISDVARQRMTRMTVERIDGDAAADTALGRALVEAGFSPGYKGLSLRGSS